MVFFQLVINCDHYMNKDRLIVDDVDADESDSIVTNVIHHIVPHIMNIFFAASNWSVVVMSVFR